MDNLIYTFGNNTLASASLVAQPVKNLSAIEETGFSLKKEMVTHSSVLAWEIPWTEEPGGLQSVGSQKVGHNLATKPPSLTSTHRHMFYLLRSLSRTVPDTERVHICLMNEMNTIYTFCICLFTQIYLGNKPILKSYLILSNF